MSPGEGAKVGLATRIRVRFDAAGDWLLLGVVLIGGLFPVLLEALGARGTFLCGLPIADASFVTRQALSGKTACTLAVLALLPSVVRSCGGGSWSALTRASLRRVILVAAGVTTAALTTFDICTGFHATHRTVEGCACWMTALVAGSAALIAALLVLASRAVVRALHDALVAIVEAFLRVGGPADAGFVFLPRRAAVAAGNVALRAQRTPRGPPGCGRLARA